MDNDQPMIIRVGMFFYVIGGGSLVLFIASDLADRVDFDYLFIAVLMMGIGWMCRRGIEPPPSAGRFAWLRAKREEAKQKKQAKQESKKK